MICYITLIGLIVALIAGDQNDPFFKFHLNNAIVILISGIILGFVAIIPILGWIVVFAGEIFLLVCVIMGIISAASGECKELPLIGKFQILK
ncbi:MAG: hypothetical protein J5517_08315 [Eubacterium sp.]|nr:hypothetical protein [Eubacterium sp.]